MTVKTCLSLIFAMALLTLVSCSKVKESLQRDMIITPNGVDFTIPVITTTTSGTVIGDFNASLDLDAEIKKIDANIGTGNIKDIKITGFQIDLVDYKDAPDADDIEDPFENNNLGNLENLNVEISANDKKATLASIIGNSSARSGSMRIPANVSALDLKEILAAPSFKYLIRIKARQETTRELKARVIPTYTITVGL